MAENAIDDLMADFKASNDATKSVIYENAIKCAVRLAKVAGKHEGALKFLCDNLECLTPQGVMIVNMALNANDNDETAK